MIIDCSSLQDAATGTRLALVQSLVARCTIETLVREVELGELTRTHFPEFWDIGTRVRPALEHGPGYALLDNLPFTDLDEQSRALYLVLLSCSLGVPQPTDQTEGRIVWDVSPRSDLPAQHTPSFTERAGEVAFHLDSAYKPWPETNVLLYCARPDPDGGGRSFLVDWHEVRSSLLATPEGRRVYEILRTCCFAFSVPTSFRRIRNESFREFVLAPIISPYVPLRWRYDSLMDGFRYFGIVGGDAVDAVNSLNDVIDESPPTPLLLRPGQCLVTDNHRVLHSRSHFTSSQRLLLRVRTAEVAVPPSEPPPCVRVVDSLQDLDAIPELVGRRFPTCAGDGAAFEQQRSLG